MSRHARRWGAIGSAVVLSLALGAGCSGGDDDAASGGGGGAEEGQAADGGIGERQLVIDHLAGVSQTYSSGDAEGAQEHFAEAEEAWTAASGTYPEAEASAIQTQIDEIRSQLDGAAPAGTVADAIETLNTELAAGPTG